MSVSLSVPIIARNIVSLSYPLDLVVYSIEDLADEVIVSVDPTSVDDSVEYIHDLMLEINSRGRTKMHYIYSVWDLDNISSTGAEFARQTNIANNMSGGDWVLSLQCDEAIKESDHESIRELVRSAESKGVDAYSMVRIYFYGDIHTVRDDWTVPIVRLFKKGTRRSCGDAMNTDGPGIVADCSVPIYHYSRIGDPEIISKRILSLDRLFHKGDKLLNEGELKPYDFNTHNFDCMHKDGVDVGRQEVKASFSRYNGSHPHHFMGYTGEK